MKIDGSAQFPIKTTNITPATVSYRTGDVVVVQAVQEVNISGTVSEVLLRFPNDDLLTAVFKDGYGKKQGEFFSIRIEGFHGKQIIAKTVLDVGNSQAPTNEVRSFLFRINIPNTADHYEIAAQMLRMGLAQTGSNFELIKKCKALYTDTSLEQIVFMIKNYIPINNENIFGIALLMAHKKLVGENLLWLFRLAQESDHQEELKGLLKAFYKNPSQEGFSFQNIKAENSIRGLVDIINCVKNHKNMDPAFLEEADAFLKHLNLQLELSRNIQSLVYLQIPINNNGNYDAAELYILDKEQDKKQEKQDQALYLRIPTKNLGVVEVLIHIHSDKSMECHFNSPLHEKHFSSQIIKLYELIQDVGYSLSKVTYNQLPSDISVHNFAFYMELIIDKKKFDEKI